MGRGDDGWHILNLHRDRSGAFAPDQLSGIPDQLTNTGPNHRIIGLDLDAETAQQTIGHFPVWTIGRIRHQSVAARRATRQVNQCNSRLSPRNNKGVICVLKCCNPTREFQRCRGAIQAI